MGCLIYDPKSCKAVAIISSKATLRERVAQVESPVTKNIKVFFITLDEDGDLVIKKPTKKSRAITEVDTDGTFVITNRKIEESNKVKIIRKFFDILKIL
jgi:type II restriction enzyme